MDPIREQTSRVSFDMQNAIVHPARKLVLCFDGTGNKFRGDDSDSNILKIYRMLDATAADQCTCKFGNFFTHYFVFKTSEIFSQTIFVTFSMIFKFQCRNRICF